ncbi:hypothetical protein [uncultured Gammaproteobacteria bacterium]|nr:hypothetical protein [uncultured Gammaproteobacteria bacterium]CAC9956399.1 hypothetical protein [uncultured Gammaproteobacteria bacterium]
MLSFQSLLKSTCYQMFFENIFKPKDESAIFSKIIFCFYQISKVAKHYI